MRRSLLESIPELEIAAKLLDVAGNAISLVNMHFTPRYFGHMKTRAQGFGWYSQ